METKKQQEELINPQRKEEMPIEKDSVMEAIPKEEIEKRTREEQERVEEITRELELRVDETEDNTKKENEKPRISEFSSDDIKALRFDEQTKNWFLREQGLSTEEAENLYFEFKKLEQSNEYTRNIAKYLPGRLREFFTRIESLEGNKLKIFVNNVEAIYSDEDKDILIRDTIHHLMHYVQIKKGKSNKFSRLLTRLPIIHRFSKNEREARKVAREIDINDPIWQNFIDFERVSVAGKENKKLKVKI